MSEPLIEPREGLPPLVTTAAALAEATERLRSGTGPVAVDAERASGFRYGHRAFLVQLRRADAGTVLIDPVTCPDLSGLDAALASTEMVGPGSPSHIGARRTTKAVTASSTSLAVSESV